MVEEIGVEELEQRLKDGLPTLLVDVRQEWEHELAALPDSLLIPLGQLPHRADEVEPEEGTLVVVYCHHGVRSLTGAVILSSQGIERAVSLAGGIDAWSEIVDPDVPKY